MKTIELDYKPHSEKEMLRSPKTHESILADGADWITGNRIVEVDGIPVLCRRNGSLSELALLDDLFDIAIDHKFHADGVRRVYTGVSYPAESFGIAERRPIRRRMGVGRTQFSYKHPIFAGVMEELVKSGWKSLKHGARGLYDAIDSAPKSLKAWRIGNTPYTSGVINASVSMPYHRDRNNVEHTGSLMWVTRRHAEGGHLHIPELNAVVDCSHGTMLVFYGEIFWHGVTRITQLSREGSGRYSVVAYAKKSVLQAKSPAEEHYLAAVRGTKSADAIRDTVLKYD